MKRATEKKLDALLEALEGKGKPCPTGYTVLQMCEKMGKSRCVVGMLLKALIREGKWRFAGKRAETNIAGQTYQTNLYAPCYGKSQKG